MKQFYVEAARVKDDKGQLEWKKIRAVLIEKMTSVEINRQTVSVSGKYHPLSVWGQKGYDVKRIEEAADWRESDLLLVVLISGACSGLNRFFLGGRVANVAVSIAFVG